MSAERVNHPAHYGGADNPYEVIKVIEAWGLGFNLGNTVKYVGRAGKKLSPSLAQANPALLRASTVEDLKKAAWYLNREIENIEKAQREAGDGDEGGGDTSGSGGARVPRPQPRRRAGVRAGRS